MSMIAFRRSEGWLRENEFEHTIVRRYFIDYLKNHGLNNVQVDEYLEAIDSGLDAVNKVVNWFANDYLDLCLDLVFPDSYLFSCGGVPVNYRMLLQSGGYHFIQIDPIILSKDIEGVNHLIDRTFINSLPYILQFVLCNYNYVGHNYHEYYYCNGLKTVRVLKLDPFEKDFETCKYDTVLSDSIVWFLAGCIYSKFELGFIDYYYLNKVYFVGSDPWLDDNPKKLLKIYFSLDYKEKLEFLKILIKALFVGTHISYEKGWQHLGRDMIYNFLKEKIDFNLSIEDFVELSI